MGKTKNVVVFATSGNPTTKQNIANVYGAKTLSALIPLDLALEFEPSTGGRRFVGGSQDEEVNKMQVKGHISRPVFGEGRQTPDRQMFFVNSRPCGLPQIAKAFNEVYKSFNVSQSPFIFADFHMDTNAYDVNVSPDKRTILLHDAGVMIESLKTSLAELFKSADQTVPQSQPSFKQQFWGISQVSVASRRLSTDALAPANDKEDEEEGVQNEECSDANEGVESTPRNAQDRMKSFLGSLGSSSCGVDTSSPARSSIPDRPLVSSPTAIPTSSTPVLKSQAHSTEGHTDCEQTPNESPDASQDQPPTQEETKLEPSQSTAISDEPTSSQMDPPEETLNTIQNAFDRMRPGRMPAEVATITIGDKTVTSMVGSGIPKKRAADKGSGGFMVRKRRIHTPSRPGIFGRFSAPGIQATEGFEDVDEEEDEEDEEDEADEVVIDEDAEDIQDGQSEDGSQLFVPDDQSDHATDDIEEEQESPKHDASDQVEPDTQASAPDSMNEEEKKAHEEAEVQRLIQEAEKAALPNENTTNRVNKMNKGAAHKDSTVHLIGSINGSLSKIQNQIEQLRESLRSQTQDKFAAPNANEAATSQQTAENCLSLTVTKDDFAKMRIIGQFNLGFIIATRSSPKNDSDTDNKDELFIIDQHASDEKFNFERLQAETVVQNQRLVQPKTLDLTAVEEEIVLENRAALEKNGFIVDIDDSGNEPIGRRCKLISLPLSKEVVFGVRDLEELIVLLSETATQSTDIYIPRPTKVRNMFAMRACRSSIMVGKNLTSRQMEKVVRNMGTIDKPWNCPHGRPTMRHLMSLGDWDEWGEWDNAWNEDGDGETSVDEMGLWRSYLEEMADCEEDVE